ncbi:MAG TPA: 50S ribosomal protein L24e [archaeon]|nr:50S ribosomal protein L24e [archaeon]
MAKCDFCGLEIEPGTGTIIVDGIGKTHGFCSSKCKRNKMNLHRNPRKVKWVRKKGKAKTK